MTISALTPIQPANNAAQAASVRQNAPQEVTQPAQDTVKLSATAIAALQAKPAEATEPAAQTQKEAATGDYKALAKLAKSHPTL